MYLTVFFLVIMISVSEACGQTIAYIARQRESQILLIVAWICYSGVVYFLYRSYQYKGVGYINILWSGMTTLLMIVIGFVLFKERLHKMEWIGACFILIGIILMMGHKFKLLK